jgi:hypothetical protein
MSHIVYLKQDAEVEGDGNSASMQFYGKLVASDKGTFLNTVHLRNMVERLFIFIYLTRYFREYVHINFIIDLQIVYS